MGEVGAVVGTDDEDIKRKRERVVKWLGKHCIYCEVTEAPQSNSKHWYKTCYWSQGLGGTLGYEQCTEWVMWMEEFRSGECGWCGESIEGCSDQGGQEVSCVYGEIILPVLFLLQGRG
ncbi:hypothetical protein VE02_09773 [Pseudogymnoascus sp. 03VT05]|nr:hypothetical protein VE02_09773 [Pseudogymnoascus sp. 03VT05]